MSNVEGRDQAAEKPAQDRRAFLMAAAKASVVVPPAMTFLLTTTMSSPAIASSCNRGIGNGPERCDPGNSFGQGGGGGRQAGEDRRPG